MTWMDGDRNLLPITYRLPDPPPLETIEGYGLDPGEQYWRHKPLPPKLAKINSMTHDGKTLLSPRMKVEMLEKNPDFYYDEIKYIQQEWDRRENGYWFFNNGVPTHITGDHYFYLQWWPIDGLPPDYRNRDRRWFWFWHMVDHDDNCFGFNNPKQRREGATKKASCIRYNRASMYKFFSTGLQSKEEEHAAQVHYYEIYEVARYMPFFFQPISDQGQNNWTEIRFYSPSSKNNPDYGHDGLSSLIDYRDSNAKAYDGVKRWIIHNDECGKMELPLDIEERVRIQIPCLTNLKRNSNKKGKLINTSTTGEMEAGGGKKFKLLCDASNYHKRNANGMTTSGLYTLFQPATEGMEGIDPKTKEPFVDRYGNANAEAIFEYLTNKREDLRKQGKMADYIEECRQYPLEYADCWKVTARQSPFNIIKLEERLDVFRVENQYKTRGDFIWAGGKPDTRVIFQPSDNGRWWVSKLLEPEKANKQYRDSDGSKYPANKNRFVAGADPFKYSKVKYRSTASKGGGAVFWKYDHSVDAGKPDSTQWESYRFAATYSHRPNTIEEYGEDMIMACMYYGCELIPEINVDFLYKYFTERGYGGYLYYKFDPLKGKYATLPGVYTHVKETQQIFAVIQTYIERHAHREVHDELLSEWKEVVDELTDFDLTVASGLALIGAEDGTLDYSEDQEQIVDLNQYLERYQYPET